MSASGSAADWEALAGRWERGRRLLWEATLPVSEWLVDRLDPKPGQTILELSAGSGETGLLAAPRLEPGGRLISSDRSARMVEAAERLAGELGVTNAEFRVLDADRLELPDASVDGVISRFGYLLKGEPPAALAEVRRVLRPQGRLAFAVWAERERNPWMTVPADVLVARGDLAPPSEAEQRLSSRRSPPAVGELVERAGFVNYEIVEIPVRYRFADAEQLWRFVSELRGPLSLAVERLAEDERAAVRAAIEAATPREGDGYALGGVSLAVLAV